MIKPLKSGSAAGQFAQDVPVGDAITQTRTLVNGMFETCRRESQAFYDDWMRDGLAALRGLQAVRSPLDLLGVQQRWLAARASAWIDANVRLMTGASLLAEDSAATLENFRLPE